MQLKYARILSIKILKMRCLKKSYGKRLSWLVIHNEYQLVIGNIHKLQCVEMYEKSDRGCRFLYIFVAAGRYKISVIVPLNIAQTNTDSNKSSKTSIQKSISYNI